jgi:hypothetical protein
MFVSPALSAGAASTSQPVVNKSSTVLDSFSSPNPTSASGASGHYTVNATVTVQNGTTGSAQFACRLVQTDFTSGRTGHQFSPTPWNYETAVNGHPATVAMTGVLRAAFSAPSSGVLMDVECRASSGTNVHATNTTFVATPVSGRQGIAPNNRSLHPHNLFVHPRRTAAGR